MSEVDVSQEQVEWHFNASMSGPFDGLEGIDEGAEGLVLVTEALPPMAPPPALRERVLHSARDRGRFARFSRPVSELLDLSLEQAATVLDALGEPSSWSSGFLAGMELSSAQRGPRAQHSLASFVRLAAGVVFPEHEHLGEERVLVLQGSCLDGAKTLRAGDLAIMPSGSSHNFKVRQGPDMMFLVVVDHGVRIGERPVTAETLRR